MSDTQEQHTAPAASGPANPEPLTTPSLKKKFDQMGFFKKENEQLKIQNGELKKERNNLRLQVESLRSELDYIKNIQDETASKHRNLATKNTELERDATAKAIEIERLKRLLAESENERKISASQYEVEIGQVKKRLGEVLSKDVEQLRAEADDARKRAAEAEERIEETRRARFAAEEREMKEKVAREEAERAKEEWMVKACDAEAALKKQKDRERVLDEENKQLRSKSYELSMEVDAKRLEIERLKGEYEDQLRQKPAAAPQPTDFAGMREIELLGAKIGEVQMEKRAVLEENTRLLERLLAAEEELRLWKSETTKNYILYFGSVERCEKLERERKEQTKRASLMNYLWRGYGVEDLPTNLATELSTKMHSVLEATLYQNVKQQDQITLLKTQLETVRKQCEVFQETIAQLSAKLPPPEVSVPPQPVPKVKKDD